MLNISNENILSSSSQLCYYFVYETCLLIAHTNENVNCFIKWVFDRITFVSRRSLTAKYNILVLPAQKHLLIYSVKKLCKNVYQSSFRSICFNKYRITAMAFIYLYTQSIQCIECMLSVIVTMEFKKLIQSVEYLKMVNLLVRLLS